MESAFRNRCWSFALAVVATVVMMPLIFARPDAVSPQGPLPLIIDVHGRLNEDEVFDRSIPLETGRIYSASVSLNDPDTLASELVIQLILADSQRQLATKSLHVGDSDATILVRPTNSGDGRVTLRALRGDATGTEYSLTIRKWPQIPATESETCIETEPNDKWEDANPIALGKTVFATCDDRDFIPPLIETERRPGGGRPQFARNMSASVRTDHEDWFRFQYDGDSPKLVHFELDFLDREVPVDVLVFKERMPDGFSGAIEEWKTGADPVSDPHEVQSLPGNKFTTRTIDRGTYYVMVRGNHPYYQLRTDVYDAPPYIHDGASPNIESIRHAAQQAVRVGVDYLIGAGDSWHANTPRAGGVLTRLASTHNETQQCIACHPTHFTTRAQEVAIANGYPVRQRGALKFLTERLYNSPRPFYGHPEATWVRMISASANVMSRLAYILNLHEHSVTHEFRTECMKGVAGYLEIYYKGRTELPPDESNGNKPLVSAYEVAGHSWVVFNEMFRRTKDTKYASYRDRVRSLIEQDHIEDMSDLCYQTIDFVQIDPAMYRDRIRTNCARILSLQRPSGQWSMQFDADSPEAEFQTGHCLYTLALAGHRPDEPRIQRGLRHLLSRQQTFGGWFDPLQSYENFKTPFRESQFAVMALSQFFPNRVAKRSTSSRTLSDKSDKSDEKGSRWSDGFPPPPARLDFTRPDILIEQLDQYWDAPSPSCFGDILSAAAHDEPIVRAAACEALGRIGDARAISALLKGLSDRSKIVRHCTAWSLREIDSRKKEHIHPDPIASALASDDDCVRRGAVRVFAQHFSYLTDRSELLQSLINRLSDPDPFVRLYASKALSQWFYWTKNADAKRDIARAYISRIATDEHPWVQRALMENFYNICDDNIRYLYRNWIPLLATKDDQDKAIRDHHALMRMLGEEIATCLESGSPQLRRRILLALTDFHLRKTLDRNGYDEPIQTPANLYARIGNDVEQIAFYDESVPDLEPILLRLLDDPSTRLEAMIASFTLRETKNLDRLPLRFLQIISDDRNARNRETAWEYFRFLPIVVTDNNRDLLVDQISNMLHGTLEARRAGLNAISRAGVSLQNSSGIVDALTAFVGGDSAGPWAQELLAALNSTPKLHSHAAVKEFIRFILSSDDDSRARAALQFILSSPVVENDPQIQSQLRGILADRDLRRRQLILEVAAANPKLEGSLHVVSLVADALHDENAMVRSLALRVIQSGKELRKNPAVRLALAAILEDPDTRNAALATSLYNGETVTFKDIDVAKLLDYEYFKEKVQPVFMKPSGRDGNACVNCHFNHAVLQLHRRADGSVTEEDARANYRSALKVINLSDPTQSLLLAKPLADASTEGQINAARVSHGGDRRWSGEQAEEYRTVLAWINGARTGER